MKQIEGSEQRIMANLDRIELSHNIETAEAKKKREQKEATREIERQKVALETVGLNLKCIDTILAEAGTRREGLLMVDRWLKEQKLKHYTNMLDQV